MYYNFFDFDFFSPWNKISSTVTLAVTTNPRDKHMHVHNPFVRPCHWILSLIRGNFSERRMLRSNDCWQRNTVKTKCRGKCGPSLTYQLPAVNLAVTQDTFCLCHSTLPGETWALFNNLGRFFVRKELGNFSKWWQQMASNWSLVRMAACCAEFHIYRSGSCGWLSRGRGYLQLPLCLLGLVPIWLVTEDSRAPWAPVSSSSLSDHSSYTQPLLCFDHKQFLRKHSISIVYLPWYFSILYYGWPSCRS